MTTSLPSVWTLASLLSWCTRYFQDKALESPRLDAELLLAHSLGLRRLDLYLKFDQPLKPQELANFKTLLKRRVAHEPVAYIIGKKEFWSRDFEVTRDVLIPRPDTETLIECVLDPLKRRRGEPPCSPVNFSGFEIGVGSGIIAVTLLAECPNLHMTALDISEAAIAVAQKNAQRHGVSDRLQLINADFLIPNSELQTPNIFDFIVSNPPYIPSHEIENLPASVKDFEPRMALNGGMDGLDFFRALVSFSQDHLKPDGFLAVEIAENQGESVVEIFRDAGFTTHLKKDHAGLDRVVFASKNLV